MASTLCALGEKSRFQLTGDIKKHEFFIVPFVEACYTRDMGSCNIEKVPTIPVLLLLSIGTRLPVT